MVTCMPNPIGDLLRTLQRLDRVLQSAVATIKTNDEPPAAPSLRGLYITPNEAAALLARAPVVPNLGSHRDACAPLVGSPVEFLAFAELAEIFQLTSFDLDVVLVALAPELDLRYERIYAYLQDDITRRCPSVDFVLNLLTSTAEERLERLGHFSLEAPLLRYRLVHLVPDPHHVEPPLLGYYLKLDEQLVRLLLGGSGMDRRLEGRCQWLEPNTSIVPIHDLPLESDTLDLLRSLIRRAGEIHRPLQLYFHGPHGIGKLTSARALASEAGLCLLVVKLAQWPEAKADFESLLRVAFREAWLKKAALYLEGVEVLRRETQNAQFSRLMEMLAEHQGITILSGTEPWSSPVRAPADVISVGFNTPEFGRRRAIWQAMLARQSLTLNALELDSLAGRFRLTAGKISNAVQAARDHARWRNAGQQSAAESTGSLAPAVTLGDLFSAVRSQCGHELAKLTRKIQPKQSWNDLVLPSDQLLQLQELCDQARHRQVIYDEWGFGRKLSLGKGLNALFAGPPGTGKTMAAEVIAGELQLDLYKLDLSQVVSKYIGETEKNLDRIFSAAESANAILLFDEADALFGKRSEVKDSHDRYANVEIGYLLQKMEEYEGVAILATNLRQNLDEAFVRRLQFVVDFPFPDEEHRRRIWEVSFPHEAPVGTDIDYAALAREVKLAGGNIKNIALAAAFYAAADGRVIHQAHLARAARREFQKLGRTWNESELCRHVPAPRPPAFFAERT